MRAQRTSLELVLATNESVTIELDPLPEPEELEVVIEMLVEEKPPAYFWTALAVRCWNEGRRAEAETIVARGCQVLPVHRPKESPALLALQAHWALEDAATAPKVVLDDAQYQRLDGRLPMSHYLRQAAEAVAHAQQLAPQHPMLRPARAALALVTGDTPVAARLLDAMLAAAPGDAVALLGRACVHLRQRQYTAALPLYQQALRAVLRFEQTRGMRWPGADPRIGLGLCLWGLGRDEDARRAWRRAAALRDDAAAPRVLLGLSLLHGAQQAGALPVGWYGAHTQRPDEEARRAAYADGLLHVQAAWQRDKSCASAAVALAAHLASQATHALSAALPPAHDMSSRVAAPDDALAATARATLERALKLGEHAIQYADTRSVVSHAWLQLARALHLAARLPGATADPAMAMRAERLYGQALEALSRMDVVGPRSHPLAQGHALAALGLAQLRASTGDALGAVQALEGVLAKPAGASAYATELALMAGLLLAQPGAAGATDSARKRARALLDRVMRTAAEARELLASGVQGKGGSLAAEGLAPLTVAALQHLGDDARVRACLADLWAPSAPWRACEQYEACLAHAPAPLSYALELNLGALLAKDSDTSRLHKALRHLDAALHAPDDDEFSVAVKIMANYNLGRAYEALGERSQAHDAYRALLHAHPEYVDARVRLAVMAAQREQDEVVTEHGGARSARDTANALFKEALSSDPTDLSVRATYMRFLAGAYPANRAAAWGALKDTAAQLFLGPEAGAAVFGSAGAARRVAEEARHDAFVLGALGWAYYQLALHAPPGPQQKAERAKGMMRAADLLDKALAAHPRNVFAAQGLAILLADDALGDPNAPPDAIEARRKQAAEDAAALFGQLRDVRSDASVYVCQGHALMICGALERASQAYELALKHSADAATLQYSARALYALGLRDQQFASLQQAMAQLDAAHAALTARKAPAAELEQLAYNRAVMAQKALQMLYDQPLEQRSSHELEEAIAWVTASQPVLASLVDAAQQQHLLYITADVVEQRAKYADMSLLRTAPQQLQETRDMEQARADQLARLDEKQREKAQMLEQRRREKEEEHRRRAEAMAESRRKAREEAAQIEYTREPSPEPKKRERKAAAPRRKKGAADDAFIAPDDLFDEGSDSDASDADGGDAMDVEGDSDRDDNDDDARASDAAAAADADADADATAAADAAADANAAADAASSDDDTPAPNSVRARLEALAKQRQQRNAATDERPKKRHGDKASRRASKKAKV